MAGSTRQTATPANCSSTTRPAALMPMMRFMTHVGARALPARNQSKLKEIPRQLRKAANASLQIRRAGDEFGAIRLVRIVGWQNQLLSFCRLLPRVHTGDV